MKLQAHRGVDYTPRLLHHSAAKFSPENSQIPANNRVFRRVLTSRCRLTIRNSGENHENSEEVSRGRRGIIFTPLLAVGAGFLRSAVVKADEKLPEAAITPPPPEKKVEEISSRIYDATAIGEPLAVGKDKSKVWEKVMNARIVYLGEAEQVPIGGDKELEVEIVKNLRKRCVESNRTLSLALEAFPCDLQEQLNQFMDGRIDGDTLRSYTAHWPPEQWQEYEPLLGYCRENEVRLVACGAPLEVMRTVQAEGIRGLSNADRKKYTPPAGSGFTAGFNAFSRKSYKDPTSLNEALTFGPSSYLSVQARAVEDYTIAQVILQAVTDDGASGLLVVITGASHVIYGPRGTGVPARISKKMQKKNQVIMLLNPERQSMRREGEVPVADFLWYSAARPCSRNCFDRAEIARVMNAAGRRRDALPQDLQEGLDLGLVSPEVLQNFFDLEQYPIISELTHRFQGFRERLLADPKFLNKLAIEEAISLTTTLIAQYEKRKENFFLEIDYVITDSVRGAVVDFFTVWLPAPTLSFLSFDEMGSSDSMDSLKGLLGSIPDNAFQKNPVGKNWNLNHRLASVVFGGLKLAGVGFVSSIAAVASSNILYALRNYLNPSLVTNQKIKRSPILKTAVVYSSFLGTSANLRYQIIAGVVEHRISELLPSQTLLVNMLSFCARVINSYWGTQQWIDLARYTGLQTRSVESSPDVSDSVEASSIECSSSDETNVNDIKNQ
ncbi:protein RETICULATA-RELATED 6, chloroplastic-like [Chenopodium quinoa]|uniref:protein RETICULATA-RELATED 6, chloroplastic-like n=1 Tax=Chenopodium quinoa TaxID=63459 RepID=UPI000B77CEC4|nr:protein RETICULATA-RELATED 6, chloroplastic-like [Chenopodium quinoa]